MSRAIKYHKIMSLSPAIIFINSDINDAEQRTLQTQLFIDDTMTKTEFDHRITVDPNYATIIHLQNLRIMVILSSFHDMVNRNLADVVMFLHQGLADIECNKFGPPGQSYTIQRLTFYELLRAAGSSNVCCLPFQALSTCGSCKYPFYCDQCHTFSGIRTCRGCQCRCKCGCDVHLPNCENEAHNIDFINRK